MNGHEALSDIARRQNEPLCLRYIAAFGAYYSQVQSIRALEVFLVVLLPAVLSFLANLYHSLDLMAAFTAIALVLVDVGLLYPLQNGSRVKGAQVQELFESRVLQLPLSPTRMANAPDIDEIEGMAKPVFAKKDRQPLEDWYAPRFAELPLELARLACLRSSCTYDAGLRSLYVRSLIGVAILVTVVLLILALRSSISLAGFILSFALPMTPALVWVIREIRDQQDARATKMELRNAICALWTDALKQTRSTEDIETATIDFQAALSFYRRDTAPVPAVIYRYLRATYEARMNDGAETLVADAQESAAMKNTDHSRKGFD